ncbi:hypothetical protein [Brevundimonas sp. R86498]|uniref:hypothetical protein n=1 Tax=Brevundimonas sp. R86498 TaxID=3093845 RepID=UPI0037CB2199
MTQPRVRYFAGPEVWTLAQEAYLRGEAAASIAARLNLTVNGLRKRAARKGWTRTQHAAALKHNAHPAHTLSLLVERIGRLAHEGRLEEMQALVATANGLVRAVRAAPPPPRPEPSIEAQRAWRAAETARLEAVCWREAQRLAEAMLSQEAHAVSGPLSLAAYHWRARVLGPEVAEADFQRGQRGGWWRAFWDQEARLKPL